jgi:multiple sugar transport system substrate-binding protein
MSKHFFIASCGLLALLLCGCPQSNTNPQNAVKKLPYEGVKLKLQIVGDPEMKKAIERYRGDWQTQFGSELEVVDIEEKDITSAERLEADALVCPSALLAPLAEKNLLAEMPKELRNSSAWSDVFELPKIREAAWAGKIYGLPFGSPLLTVYCRADLLEKLQKSPPKTWPEYQELAKLLAAEKTSTPESPWYGTLEPLAPGWAGQVLLARAAPYVKHRDYFATWFDTQTMEPLIDSPPVVKALTQLVDAAKTNSAAALKCDPDAVRRAFWAGQCGMAVTWPSASERLAASDAGNAAKKPADEKSAAAQAEMKVAFVELPGTLYSYNQGDKKFEPRRHEESPNVEYLGIAGRLGVVSSAAPESSRAAAFALLGWLSDAKRSSQISPASKATTLFRKSHIDQPTLWTEPELSGTAAAQYATLSQASLDRETWVDFRLPGREEYLAALDTAVLAAVEGKSTPADALKAAADQWRAITEKHGKDQQKSAYLHSLEKE